MVAVGKVGMQTSQHPELAPQPAALPPVLLYQRPASFPVPCLLPSCADTRHPVPPSTVDSVPASSSCQYISLLVPTVSVTAAALTRSNNNDRQVRCVVAT